MHLQDILNEADKSLVIIRESQDVAQEAIRQRDLLLDALKVSAKIVNAMHTGTLPKCFKPTLEVVNQINAAIAVKRGR